ncbi:hypothetical protein E4U53_006310 [Claviceps sorghi]|nr:hypothetical protein E4U53_006310 [Claviceps sorghi]
MTSLKTAYGLPARPSDGYRSRKSEDDTPRGAISGSMNRTGSEDMGMHPRPGFQTSPPSHHSNKTAETRTSPGSALPRSAMRSRSDPHNKTLSEIPKSHRQTGSGSSSSMRSFNNASKATRLLQNQVRPNVPRESGPLHRASETSRPSISAHQSQKSADAGLGIQHDREATESPTQMDVLEAVKPRKSLSQPAAIYPELDRYRDFQPPNQLLGRQEIDIPCRSARRDLSPPTPLSLWFSGSSQISAVSASPSTKFSESPGPGPYSRDTTPTSLSSQSPVFVASNCLGAPYRTTRQYSASSARRRAGSFTNGLDMDTEALDPTGLASVRESLASSSSNSTVKEGARTARKEKTKGDRLPPSPPTPPPRLPSQKLDQPKDTNERSNMISLLHNRYQEVFSPTVQSPPSKDVPSLSRKSPPARPRRHNTPSMDSQLSTATPTVIQSNLASTMRGVKEHGGVNIGKRTSSEDVAKVDGKPEQKSLVRKGPVAGTGHEGYGRVGAVRKRSGSGSALPHKVTIPQSSLDSLTSSDSFLADRVNPVIISGGEVVENRNTSSGSSRPDPFYAVSAHPGTESNISPGRSSLTRVTPSSPTARSPLLPSQAHSTRRPSNSSAPEGIATQSSLAFRRSMQRLRSVPDTPLRLPQPINTGRNASSESSLTSFDTSILSDGSSHIEMQRGTSGESSALHPMLKKVQKIPLSSRKWNIFSRSHNQTKPEKGREKEQQITATVQAVEKRPVAFYTIIDTIDHQIEREEIPRAEIQGDSREADLDPQSVDIRAAAEDTFALQRPSTPQRRDSSPPQSWFLSLDNTSTTTISSSSAAGNSHPMSSGRPTRLAQVGRIPQVVKKRQKSSSQQSFSRPFQAILHLSKEGAEKSHDTQSISAGPVSAKSQNAVPELSMEDSTFHGKSYPVSSTTLSSSVTSPDAGLRRKGRKEFLSFSPRKNSESMMHTSSRSLAAGISFATTTAVVPNPDDPPIEDEVWDEYNDLLGDDSLKEAESPASWKGVPLHSGTDQGKLTKQEALDFASFSTDSGNNSSMFYRALKDRNCYSADVIERIPTALLQPRSNAMTDRLPGPAAVGCGGSKSLVHAARESTSKRSSSSSCRTLFSDCSACSSSPNDVTSLAQVKLRVGSMTVSKWLTFGHVLFSEIRHQLNPGEASARGHSILVVDGLGNDDWSFYAAETYPSASFFNLSPRAPLPPALKNDPKRFPLSLPNHHQVQYTSHLDKFPFASQSFDGVVYRFPPVAPESHYRNIISEARRVLRPDGYIELSILDFDLIHMGSRGRRTVRRLKERILLQDPETSFASTSDLTVRLLGTVGFAKIKAARVGVPVASSIAQPGSHKRTDKSELDKKKDPPSLAEMMSDKSPSADESITKIVTRVGRWWYTRCYESVTGPKQEKSIWDDRSLLSECEQYRTSLKLMVCCARAV